MHVPLICLLAIATCLGCESKPKATQPQTPPPEITKLVPPIEIVDANGFDDGGTLFVKLRDSAETEVVFCVSQDFFKNEIPPNTLYVGAPHASQPSARLPVSSDERLVLVEGLKNAVETSKQRDSVYWFAKGVLEKLQSTKTYTDADLK
jgi:hypothetical protein